MTIARPPVVDQPDWDAVAAFANIRTGLAPRCSPCPSRLAARGTKRVGHRHPPGPRGFGHVHAVRAQSGTFLLLDRLDATAADSARQRLRATLDAHDGGSGVLFDSRGWIITARNPESAPSARLALQHVQRLRGDALTDDARLPTSLRRWTQFRCAGSSFASTRGIPLIRSTIEAARPTCGLSSNSSDAVEHLLRRETRSSP